MKRHPTVSIYKQRALPVIFLSVALNAVTQILLKSAHLAHPDSSFLTLFLRVETWAGLIVYGLSAICWLWVLSRVPLSFAYPILSLTFPIVVGLSALFFLESITLTRWIGIAVIVIGVSLLART